MALRLNSLKTRTALAIASVIVVTLLANAVYLILAKRSELRAQIEREAKNFVQLTKDPLAVAYLDSASGGSKFRELVRDAMRLNTDVERILIADVRGQVLFDSDLMDARGLRVAPAGGWISEPSRLEALRRLEPSSLRGRDPGGAETLEIIAPHFQDWGRHQLSLVYQVSYRSLKPKLAELAYATGGLTLLSILVSALLAVALASRITRPLEELTAGAQDIAEGHFDRRLTIRSNDEIEMLSETFNHMTERLKEIVRQLEESNAKLGTANEELKELDRMKSDLLANVSHELRTPLTAIKGYTDYILERKLGPISEKQEKGLIVMQRNLDRLARSIGALLDFSRMELARVPLNIQPFSLPALLEQIVTTFRSELERKRLSFTTRLEPDLPPVIADREKLSAVLENLVVNAIKFTPQGGRITVSARREPAASRPSAEIRVADTGIGIPSDQIEKIFNRFYQVDTSTTRRFGGVGLGLAIVKSILEAHGAAIAVESQPHRGTVFRFSLPLLEKQELAGREERRAGEPLVLVVEGGADSMEPVREALRRQGFRAVVARGGAQALEAVVRERPDLVILDSVNRERDQAEVVEALRREGAGIPLLRLADLPRPLDPRALVAEVSRQLGREEGEGARRANA